MAFFNQKKNKSPTENGVLKLIVERGNGFYSWNGKLYQSDIIRSCTRPKAKAVGKLTAQHLRKGQSGELKTNPEVYIKFLLEEPNPVMTGQKLLEKLTNQLELNNNAFACIVRDENDFPRFIYPIIAAGVEAVYNTNNVLFLKFTMPDGKIYQFPYKDIIHLRQDYNDNSVFGSDPTKSLAALMEVVNTTDQGIVKAIRSSSIIKWMLKFKQTMHAEDVKKEVESFEKDYLSVNSSSSSVVPSGSKYDTEQVKSENYVPNAAQMDRTIDRYYNFFGTNKKIIQSSYSEDEWNSYYEAQIEPIAQELSNEFTRKLFNRMERSHGNSITFSSISLQYASMSNKLNLLQMVDRGAMTPNEWREVMNLTPIDGGDKPVRRLDTAVVENMVNEIMDTFKKEMKNQINLLEKAG